MGIVLFELPEILNSMNTGWRDLCFVGVAGAALYLLHRKPQAGGDTTSQFRLIDPDAPMLSPDVFRNGGRQPEPKPFVQRGVIERRRGVDPVALVETAFAGLQDDVFVISAEGFEVLYMNARAAARASQLAQAETLHIWDVVDGLGVNGMERALKQLEQGAKQARVPAKLLRKRALLELRPIYEKRAVVCYVAVLRPHSVSEPMFETQVMSNIFGLLGDRLEHLLEMPGDRSAMLQDLRDHTRDLALFSRLSSGAADLSVHPVDLVPFLQHAIDDLKGQADQKRVNLRVQAMEEAGNCLSKPECDTVLLSRMVNDILCLALNNARSDSDIVVSHRVTGAAHRVSVINASAGFDPTARAHLFEVSAEALGPLCLAKAIAEAHKGFLGLRSVEGQGSVVYFDLPGV